MMRGTEFSTGKFYTRSKKLHGTAAIRLIVIAATWDRGGLTASAVDAWARGTNLTLTSAGRTNSAATMSANTA
jgi:hypothetical protein